MLHVKLEEIVIPTYLRGEDSPYPPLTFGKKPRKYKPYPYCMQDDIDIGSGGLKYDPKIKHRVVRLSNGILEALVMPDMNGRVYSLRNIKTGREIFYRNNVVKPALVSIRGAWISGGVEFNAPTLGHSASTISPVCWHIEENENEAAVVVGDVDRSARERWQVRISLKKGRAALDIETEISNPNKYRERLYYWENAAVPVGDDLRFVCNSDWTGGGKIKPWPVQDGADRSLHVNNYLPVDHFGYRTHTDFFGAHYSEKRCGTYHVALRTETAGQKYFSWGMREDNKIWESYLTDSDGQYIELQSGLFESQSVTGWLESGQCVSFSGSWFGTEDIGELTWANKHAAMAVSNAGEKMSVDIASLDLDGQFSIRILRDGHKALHRKIKLAPGENSKVNFKSFGDFELLLLSEDNELVFQESWQSKQSASAELAPKNWSVDSASAPNWNQIGVLGKYHSWLSAIEEAGKHEKDMPLGEMDAALAEIYLKTHQLELAQKHIDKALAFLPGNRCLHLFAATAALRKFRKEKSAALAWKINDHCQASRSNGALGKTVLLILAEFALLQGRVLEAKNILEPLIRKDGNCPETLALYSGICRKCGDFSGAEKAFLSISSLWPQRAGEMFLANGDASALKGILSNNGNAVEFTEFLLEWLMMYWRVAWLDDLEFLLKAVGKEFSGCLEHPVFLLMLADCALEKGERKKAVDWAEKAESCSMKYVFSYRWEDAVLLELGSTLLEGEAPALKYLTGIWLAQNGQCKDAVKNLRDALRSSSIDEIKRLSSQALSQWSLLSGDVIGQSRFLKKAFKAGYFDRRLFLELDEALRELQDVGYRKTLANNIPEDIQGRGDIAFRRARLLFDDSQAGKALDIVLSHKFSQHEGQSFVRRLYVDSLLVDGLDLFASGDFSGAAQRFEGVMKYPENLGSASYLGEHSRLARFILGMIDDSLGDRKKAEALWRGVLKNKDGGEVYNGAEFSFGQKIRLDELAAIALCAHKLDSSSEQKAARNAIASRKEGEDRVAGKVLLKILDGKNSEAIRVAEKALGNCPCSALLRIMLSLAAADILQ